MKIQFTSRTKFGLIAVLFLSTLLACQTEKKDPSQQELAKEFPHEWMYNQRAYPNNFINKKAMEKAVLQTRAILSERPENQGTDWELIGPLNTGGRITDIAISPSDDDTFFVTTPVGGVFKTTDRGQTWNAVFDGIGKPSIGNIAIAPSNENIIYVGTGEANGSATSGAFFGDGVYRSSDAGESWTHVGLPNSNHIGRIVIDPTDPDRVFAAATGQLYGKNDDRGIYKTLNGGAAWERVLFVTDSTAAIDVAMNPVNPDILFAAMWERTREPWQRDYGGETSAVHRSLDGGDTWTELGVANGLPVPSTERGRIGLTISAAEPSTVYARYTTNEITNSFDAIYKSTDNGSTWNEINTASITFIDASFGWYFGNIRVNPNDPTQLWVLGQSLYRTNNDGALWSPISGMHVDHHAMEFSTNNPNMVVAGNDGGAYISENGGNSWINSPIFLSHSFIILRLIICSLNVFMAEHKTITPLEQQQQAQTTGMRFGVVMVSTYVLTLTIIIISMWSHSMEILVALQTAVSILALLPAVLMLEIEITGIRPLNFQVLIRKQFTAEHSVCTSPIKLPYGRQLAPISQMDNIQVAHCLTERSRQLELLI